MYLFKYLYSVSEPSSHHMQCGRPSDKSLTFRRFSMKSIQFKIFMTAVKNYTKNLL
jgi:hypothetical protein